ncbi:ATP-binding protein [Sulfuricurvum sp.]|uniref:sensor histidine kinase n=1 Tax=Sulfuricurvum sp. TaxID=2025608 RepID=UPI0026186DB3|nr:ATP-binding protein [Sulfuricurvum sp.]MDD4884220.1 ATP-binding protein [Sulfuricurvum sp.]
MADTYHRLLMRQMRRFLNTDHLEELAPFLESISAFYEDAEKERKLWDRILEVSSRELEEANRSLRQQNRELQEKEELRLARDAAIEEMNQAIEANRAKDTFLSSMSHELRTPLNAIIGFSQILLAKKDTPESVKGFVEKIHLSGKNLLSLVNTILDFSKIEAGKVEIHQTTWGLKELMEEVKILLEPMAEKKRLRIDIRMDMTHHIYADRQLIKQVMVNLISNAVKFSPEGESIAIEHCTAEGQEVFRVCDHGHGIAPEKIDSLFEPFVQIREHQNEAIKGTGLGLTIVKRIIELHTGKIWIESRVGEGSCFIFSLPVPS